MVTRLEHTVFILYEEASQYIISHQFYQIMPGVLLRGRIDDYFLRKRDRLRLDHRLEYLLKEITVMTASHLKVMFESWLADGKKPVEGKVVLSTESILDLVETHKTVSAAIEQEINGQSVPNDKDHDMGGLKITTIGLGRVSDLDSPIVTTPTRFINATQPFSTMGSSNDKDVEMTDAGDNTQRRASLIIRLPAPSTILRELNKTKEKPPAPVPQTMGNARANLKKSKGTPHFSDIMQEMSHFGESRMEQITATTKERNDPFLRRIRELDRSKSAVREEMKRLSEEAIAKSQEFDRKLSNLELEADYYEQRAIMEGLGINGFVSPDQDLNWNKYQLLVQEKADHEIDITAKREKLVRRGITIHEEKKRIAQMYEVNSKWEKHMESLREQRRMELLMLERPLRPESSSDSLNSIPSTREASAAAGASSDKPGAKDIPSTSTSSGRSSIFSADEGSTSASTSVPDKDGIDKTPMFNMDASFLLENPMNYGQMLLAGIRNSGLFPDSDERPPPPSKWSAGADEASLPKKLKKRTRKGW